MALIQDPETKRKEAETRLIALRAQQMQLAKDIEIAEREAKGISEVCPGVTRARDVLFVDFEKCKFNNDVEFDYCLDPDCFDEPSFNAGRDVCYSSFEECNSIDRLIEKAKYWRKAYDDVLTLFTTQKELGARYIQCRYNCAPEAFDFDIDESITPRKGRKRK